MKAGIGRSKALIVTGLIAITLSFGVVGGASAANKPIKIGLVTFLSGPAAGTFGVPVRNAAKLLADELNAGNVPAPYSTKGIGGRPIKLTFVDESGGATKQVAAYRNLVQQQGADVVVGYISSGDCLAVAPVAEKLKRLTVFFGCGTPELFEDASYKYVFRAGATGAMDAVAAAMYLKDQGIKINQFAGINQNYAWGHDSWNDFVGAMKQLYPNAKIATAQFPKLMAGHYGAEISTLMSSGASVVFSSFWGGDTNALIVQGSARGLFKKDLVILSVGQPSIPKLGKLIPDGTVIGARGTFSEFAPNTPLNKWFRKAYIARYHVAPTYPTYKLALAILGVKAAYEKAQKADSGKAPDQNQVIKAFTYLTWTGPGGQATMALGKGHQVVYGTAYGRVKHVNGKLKMVDVEYFPADKVTPPPGVKTLAWIKSGFKR